jgi:hypothetical protein
VGFCLVLAGVVLFLYGANYFDAVVGWAGIFLVAGGIVAAFLLRIVLAKRKKREGLEAVKL